MASGNEIVISRYERSQAAGRMLELSTFSECRHRWCLLYAAAPPVPALAVATVIFLSHFSASFKWFICTSRSTCSRFECSQHLFDLWSIEWDMIKDCVSRWIGMRHISLCFRNTACFMFSGLDVSRCTKNKLLISTNVRFHWFDNNDIMPSRTPV